MRIKLTVEYDGTEYCGWQVQPNGVTVQQRLNEAIRAVTGVEAQVTGSGRTDSGVHAEGQVAHFETSSTIPPERFAPALNSALPSDIRVVHSELAGDDFHARFCAKKKTYRYRMYLSETIRPLKDRYSVQLPYPVDILSMRAAAEVLVGTHDFSAFMSSGSEVKDTVRTVYSAEVSCSGDDITFTVCGNGFLYNMVRIMVGTLVDVGLGKLTCDDVRLAVSGEDRSKAGKTMPARGLTLVSVEY